MQKVISAIEMRELDRRTVEAFALPSLLLMEQAAAGAMRYISAHFGHELRGIHARVFCGTGNNGGDGAALARLLWIAGVEVEVVLLGRTMNAHGDARINFEIIQRLAADAARHTESPAITFIECATEDEWSNTENRLTENRLTENRSSGFVLVDALFGTGLSRAIEGVHARVINHINNTRRLRDEGSTRGEKLTPFIVSLDLPSGLAADSAFSIGAVVQADLTVTFTAPKLANILPPASRYNGRLAVVSIGTSFALVNDAESQTYVTEKADPQSWLRRTRYIAGSYKNSHGHVLVIAGSRDMSGAPVLCSNAAFAAGAGLVTLATSHSAFASAAARARPEVMVGALADDAEHGSIHTDALERTRELAGRATVIAIGPGLTTAEETRRFVREVVTRRTLPVVIDADALNALTPWSADLRGTTEAPLILTPHEGEMRRLLGDDGNENPLADRIGEARRFASAYNLFLVLKGERTIVAAPDGRVVVNPTGNPGLGTAGAGDTLTGIIASFVAQECATRPATEADIFASVVAATYVGGVAGDVAAERKGLRAMTASDITEGLSEAIRRLDPAGERP